MFQNRMNASTLSGLGGAIVFFGLVASLVSFAFSSAWSDAEGKPSRPFRPQFEQLPKLDFTLPDDHRTLIAAPGGELPIEFRNVYTLARLWDGAEPQLEIGGARVIGKLGDDSDVTPVDEWSDLFIIESRSGLGTAVGERIEKQGRFKVRAGGRAAVRIPVTFTVPADIRIQEPLEYQATMQVTVAKKAGLDSKPRSGSHFGGGSFEPFEREVKAKGTLFLVEPSKMESVVKYQQIQKVRQTYVGKVVAYNRDIPAWNIRVDREAEKVGKATAFRQQLRLGGLAGAVLGIAMLFLAGRGRTALVAIVFTIGVAVVVLVPRSHEGKPWQKLEPLEAPEFARRLSRQAPLVLWS